MSRLTKAVTLGFITGILGVILSLLSPGNKLEEEMGLDMLFKMRGQRKAPSDVIVVSIDKKSSDELNLPNNAEKWPRILHAKLTDTLAKEGARVIAFDIFFSESRQPEDETAFARAIDRAQNVILVESIKREKVTVKDDNGLSTGDLNVERLVPPLALLAQSSLAVAPFPLPKVPVKLSQYWTFKPTAGDVPTLPVMVLQVFALGVYEDFIGLLGKFHPFETGTFPPRKEDLVNSRSVSPVVSAIRNAFEKEPVIAEKMLEALRDKSSFDEKRKHVIQSLIKMYQNPKSQFINFYGPPRSITTVPYNQVLEENNDLEPHDFNGKAVFVGSSEIFQPEQRDGFYTVFSQPNGLDISGVEIAATAFANLLEDMPIRQLPVATHVLLIFIWGAVMGFLCRILPNIFAAAVVLGAGVLYGFVALKQFTTIGLWYPLIIPLFFQAPVAFFGTIVWKYIETNKERQNIKKAFRYYLPDDVVDRISRNISDVEKSSQVVYGTCLATDAEQYTALSETMEPGELSNFLNKYYKTIFKPVKRHEGIVSNVIADSMLALWVTVQNDEVSRKRACLAALDIRDAVTNRSPGNVQMPTRVGLHSGQILLGNIGTADHYEYRPVGDIVNTSTRIEGLNKYLGTKILLSEDVLSRVDGLMAREVGKFLLAGKSKPIVLYELMCRADECSEQQRDLCMYFDEALEAFRRQSWKEASEKFKDIANRYENDSPSLFYVEQCELYRERPYDGSWDGAVRLDKK
jgi:adenylate cyclase